MTYLVGNPVIASAANSSTAPLSGSATFTGTADTSPLAWVIVTVLTDAAGTLHIDLGDGTNWDETHTHTIRANTSLRVTALKGSRSFRVRVVNGSSLQTFMRLVTATGPLAGDTVARNGIIEEASPSLVVRPSHTALDRVRGLIRGESGWRMTAYNPAITTSPEALWPAGGTYTGFLTAATTIRVAAGGNANDDATGSRARTVVVEGLDANFEPVSETITLAGASASSATTASFIRINRAYVEDCGTYHSSNQGAITIENSGGGTTLALIDANRGETQQGIYTVPAGKTAYLCRFEAETSGACDVAIFVLREADDSTVPVRANRLQSEFAGLNGTGVREFGCPLPIPEKSDVYMLGVAPTGTVRVSAEASLILIDN